MQARAFGYGERLRRLHAKIRPRSSNKSTLSWMWLARLADVRAARVGEDVFFFFACQCSAGLVWDVSVSARRLRSATLQTGACAP